MVRPSAALGCVSNHLRAGERRGRAVCGMSLSGRMKGFDFLQLAELRIPHSRRLNSHGGLMSLSIQMSFREELLGLGPLVWAL